MPGKFFAFALAIAGFLLPLHNTAASAQETRTVTLATDVEKQGGFLLELTTEAFKRAGYKVEVQFMPWARAVDSTYKGIADGLLGCLYSDERAKSLVYADEVAESPYVFFALKTPPLHFTKVSDLRSHTVGTIGGSVYPAEFADDAEISKQPVADYKLNVLKLLAGHIDAFVDKKFVVLNYLKNSVPENADTIVILDPPLLVNKFYNAFSRQNPNAAQLAKDFNDGLAKLKADGGYAAIMAKGLHE
jgi:polar amino acid transport system substrate-binding protein